MKLVVLFSKGGLGDVGRHAVRAALDRGPDVVEHVTVISQHTESLLKADEDNNWNCGCVNENRPHTFTDDEKDRMTIVSVDSFDNDDSDNNAVFISHFEGAGAVISCLGNRQINLGDRVGGAGSRLVVKAMNKKKIERVVVISSMGVKEDWPPIEFHWVGKIMSCIFLTCGRKDYKDLSAVEEAFRSSKDIDYLIVRPVGLGEDVPPRNEWLVQKEKYKDTSLDIGIAKLDCARFMVEEAIKPTRHKTAVVVGWPKTG